MPQSPNTRLVTEADISNPSSAAGQALKIASQTWGKGDTGDITPELLAAKNEATSAAANASAAASQAAESASQAAESASQAAGDSTIAGFINNEASLTRSALNTVLSPPVTCLWIGDSFTQGYQASSTEKRYSTLVSNTLGWTEVNYAVGGSGFTVGGEFNRTYLQQAQLAKTNGVNPNVVVVAGVQNDGTNVVSSAAATALAYITSTWPNAKYYAIPAQWSAKAIPQYLFTRADEFTTAALDAGFNVIRCAWQWLYGETSLVASDNSHPNDAGYARMAKYVVQGIRGYSTAVTRIRSNLTLNTGWSDNQSTLVCTEGMVTFGGGFTKSSNAAYNDKICTIPLWASPSQARFVTGSIGADARVLIRIAPDGTVVLASWPSGVTGTQIFLPTTAWGIGS